MFAHYNCRDWSSVVFKLHINLLHFICWISFGILQEEVDLDKNKTKTRKHQDKENPTWNLRMVVTSLLLCSCVFRRESRCCEILGKEYFFQDCDAPCFYKRKSIWLQPFFQYLRKAFSEHMQPGRLFANISSIVHHELLRVLGAVLEAESSSQVHRISCRKPLRWSHQRGWNLNVFLDMWDPCLSVLPVGCSVHSCCAKTPPLPEKFAVLCFDDTLCQESKWQHVAKYTKENIWSSLQ